MERRAGELRTVDEARAEWYAHTAETRAAAERATAELTARGITREASDDTVTAEEWLAAHHAATAAEDPHREIADEAELTDIAAQRDTDTASAVPDDIVGQADPNAAETTVADVRDIGESDPAQADEDTVRVPSADETAASVQRAQRALAEIRARRLSDDRDATEHRAAQLARWQADDNTAQRAAGRGHEPATLALGGDHD